MEKAQALRYLGLGTDASFSEAKKSFRRQAMKWHPDRNKSPGAEEKFKEVRACFEFLEAIEASGKWSHVGQAASASASNEGGRGSNAREHWNSPRPSRKPWDPLVGPTFDCGWHGWRAQAKIAAFFESFLNVCEALKKNGAGPSTAGLVLARGLNGFLMEASISACDIPVLRGELLLRFWRRRVSMFDALACAEKKMLEWGWAKAVAGCLDPLVEIFSWDGGFFYIFDQVGQGLPEGEPSEDDLYFYRAWVSKMPTLFANFASNEQALRLGLRLRRIECGAPFMESVLKRCPKAAEVFAPSWSFCSFSSRQDWIGMALAGGASVAAIDGWLAAEPLSNLCARIGRLPKGRRAPVVAIAERRLAEQRLWHLAGRWATPKATSMAMGHRRWLAIVAKLRPGLLGQAKRSMGLLRESPAAGLARHAIFSPLPVMDEAFSGKVGPKLRRAAQDALGCPLAVACAMRAFFDEKADIDFMARFKILERHWKLGELAKPDPEGRTCLDWLEMAIERR